MLSCWDKKTLMGKLFKFVLLKTIWIIFFQYTTIQNGHALKKRNIAQNLRPFLWIKVIRDICPYLYFDSCKVQSHDGELLLACISWSVYTVYSFKAGSLAHTGTVFWLKGVASSLDRQTDTHTLPITHNSTQAKHRRDQRIHSLKHTW